NRQGARPRSAGIGAHPRRRGDRIGAPAASWCDPAGESPVQVRSSVRLVASVAWPLATVGCEAYTVIAWGVGLSHERSYIAGAESFYSLEGNMCGTAMRGADALPGSKAASRAKGTHRKLGGLASLPRTRYFAAMPLVRKWHEAVN